LVVRSPGRSGDYQSPGATVGGGDAPVGGGDAPLGGGDAPVAETLLWAANRFCKAAETLLLGGGDAPVGRRRRSCWAAEPLLLGGGGAPMGGGDAPLGGGDGSEALPGSLRNLASRPCGAGCPRPRGAGWQGSEGWSGRRVAQATGRPRPTARLHPSPGRSVVQATGLGDQATRRRGSGVRWQCREGS